MTVATFIEAPRITVNRVCDDAVAIPKGTTMKLSGTNTVYASLGSGEAFGGITVEEKTASDGVTHVACAMDGVVDIVNSSDATETCGTIVVMSGANMYRAAVAGDLLTGAKLGKLEEVGTAAGTDRVRLNSK